MKKITLLFTAIFLSLSSTIIAQKVYITKAGEMHFFSAAPLENIEATSHLATGVMKENGAIAARVLINTFEFEKPLMQKHFNENYMDSEQFPQSKFSGKVANISEMDLSKDGVYPAKVAGSLTIKDATNEVMVDGYIVVGEGTITKKDKTTITVGGEGKVTAYCVFPILLKDYNVKIEAAKLQNISDSIEVTINLPMNLRE